MADDFPLEDLKNSISELHKFLDIEFMPTGISSPTEIYEAVVTVRRHLTELDNLIVTIQRTMAGTIIQRLDAQASYDDAWANVAETSGKKSTTEAPRERYAHYDLQCIDQQISLRRKVKTEEALKVYLDVVRHVHRALTGQRQDLELAMRAFNLESRLEH